MSKMPNASGDVYKIAVLGDEGSGKTALLVRFLTGRYIVDYDPTIEDYYRKIFLVNDEPESVDILDTTRLKQDSTLRKDFLVNGDGFVVVYSITNRQSFEMIDSYEKEIRESRRHQSPKPYRVHLVGNKCDMTKERQVGEEEGRQLAAKYGWTFYEASAAENIAISEVFFGLTGLHSNPLAEVLGSSSDSDSACAHEKHSKKKKVHRKCGQEKMKKFSNFRMFRWNTQ